MNARSRARHIVRRYAEGGSDDEETAGPLQRLGGVNPVQNVVGQHPVLQIDPLSGPRSGAVPTRTEPVESPVAREDLANQVAGQLVERYGDNHQAISERMLNLDPADHNNVLAALPPSVRNGVIDHRLGEALRVINPPPDAPNVFQDPRQAVNYANHNPPRQPGASRTGYVSPYGIYGQSQLSDKEYEALKNPEQLSQDEAETLHVPSDKHPFDYMSNDAWDNYNKFIKPKFGDVYNFVKKFFAGYDPGAIKVDSGEMYGYGPGSLNLEGQLHDKGNRVADFDASIIPGSKGAHLGYFEIDPEYRGVAGPALLRSQIDAYKKMGLNFVDLLAAAPTYNSIFGGSYAWAKYGFTPTRNDWNMIRQTALKKLESGELAPVDPEEREIAKNILNTLGPRAIWPLSDMKSPTASGMPYGKAVLLGGPSWHGELTFKDLGAMRRFDAYIARPKKPKAD